MTRPAADSVKVSWAGTGTATISLGSAVAGFQAFPSDLDGMVVSYAIEHENGNERENGIGTYTLSGNTLSRDLVTFSTAGAPTKESFTAGTKNVRLSLLALDFVENRATVDPGLSDDISAGYVEGRSRWLNTATKRVFFCRSHAAGAARWDSVPPAVTAVKTSAYTARPGETVRTDSSAGSFNVTAPTSPFEGDTFAVEDTGESWETTPVTLITTDGATIAGFSGTEGVLLDGGNASAWRREGTNWAFVGQTGLLGAGGEGVLPLTGGTMTGEIRGNGVMKLTRGAATTQPTVADSGAWITSNGAITIPNTAIGNGWFHCTLEFGGDHDVTFNSLTWNTGASAGDVVSIVVHSASVIRITPVIAASAMITQADFV